MLDASQELPRGTLDLMILKVVSLEPMHGWGIMQRIRQFSGDVFEVNQGSLYPVLRRLTREGWLRSEWKMTQNSRRARYYTLTTAGEEQMGIRRQQWAVGTDAVRRVLEAEG